MNSRGMTQIFLIAILLFAAFILPERAFSKDEWGSVSSGNTKAKKNTGWDDAKEILDDATNPKKHRRINDLPGNPNDVDKRNVWSAKNNEIYQERREIEFKLKQLDEIERKENSKWYKDKAKLRAIEENRYRLKQRVELLDNEIMVRKYGKKKFDGFVPETSEHKPLDPNRNKKPEAKWGGPLPEVSNVNPSTMGRSQIDPEMKQLNKDLKEMRKRLDRMNAVGDFSGKIGQKQQVQNKINKITQRLNALEAEKQRQIQNGTWPQTSDDIIRTKATKAQIDQAYREGKELGEALKTNNMSSAEVKHATRDAYSRFQNNEKLKDAFKRGYRAGAQ